MRILIAEDEKRASRGLRNLIMMASDKHEVVGEAADGKEAFELMKLLEPDVVFTDIETGEQYIIGYITHGVTEKINLEKDKWYKVEGGGNLTLYPVSIRVE